MKRIILFLTLPLFFYSCVTDPDPVTNYTPGSYLDGTGVFIINEGNFRSGNGSLSFFSYDSAKVYNDVFHSVNQRLLGDVPYSMNFSGIYGYIVVNNSGKIEVVNASDIRSVKTITGLVSPRYISFTGDGRAYISSLYSDSIAVYNVASGSITGYINVKKPAESIQIVNTTAYAARWTGDNKIIVINTTNDQVTDSIEVGMEPESMVIDKDETLWVLCNGGWQRENYAELIGISIVTNSITKRFVFPSKTDSPTCLQIDGKGETLYYLQDGIKRMSISETTLPSAPLITQGNHNFYKLGINPDDGEIFVTDVVDYLQKGYLLRYTKSGTLISSMGTDIIPGSMYFKVKPAGTTE
jgi:YVTN family beta-propeller protein